MKNYELLDAVGGIDARHINAAAETKKHRMAWMGWVAAVACLALVAVLVVPLFRGSGSSPINPIDNPPHGGDVAENPFFPSELMITDGRYIYIASANTRMLYVFEVDGTNTKLVAETPVELPFESGPDMETDFCGLYVYNNLLYLIGTRAENHDPINTDYPFENFVEVYSIDNHTSFHHVSSFQLNGDLYTWRPDGNHLFIVTRSFDIHKSLYYIANGEKTALGDDSIEAEDASGDLFFITAIDMASGTEMTVRQAVIKDFGDSAGGLTNYEELDAWLDAMIGAGLKPLYVAPHTEEKEIHRNEEGWGRITVDTGGNGTEWIGVMSDEVLFENNWYASCVGGSALRIGDLLFMNVYIPAREAEDWMEAVPEIRELLIISPETIRIVEAIPYK